VFNFETCCPGISLCMNPLIWPVSVQFTSSQEPTTHILAMWIYLSISIRSICLSLEKFAISLEKFASFRQADDVSMSKQFRSEMFHIHLGENFFLHISIRQTCLAAV
jgi:hypothetical protein